MRREAALHAAQLLAGDQGKVIASAEQLMRLISQFPEVQSSDVPACNRRLEQLLSATDGYLGFVVTDPTGMIRCQAPSGTNPRSLNTSASPYFLRAVQRKSFIVGGLVIGRISGRPSLSFGYPVLDQQGHVLQVIGAGLSVDTLNPSLSAANMPAGGVAMVLDSDGHVLMHSISPEQFVGQVYSNTALVQTVLSERTGITDMTGADQVERAYAFAPYRLTDVSGGPGQPNPPGEPVLYAVIGYPLADLYAAANADLTRSLLIFAAVVLGASVLAWLAGDIIIVRRAKRIIHAAKSLAAGDLTARTGVNTGMGELSLLARNFDDMADALEQHQQERDQAQADLAISETRHRLLADVGEALAQSFANPSPLAPLPGLLVPRLADWCSVTIRNANDTLSVIASTHRDEEQQQLEPHAPTLPGDVSQILNRHPALREGEPCLVDCLEDEPLPASDTDASATSSTSPDPLRQTHAQTMPQRLFVPLMHRNTLTGLLILGMNGSGRRFDDASMALAREVAQRAALSLENTVLYETEKQAHEQASRNARYLAQLNHLAARLTPALSRDAVIEAILDDIATSIRADAAAVNLTHEDGQSWGIVQSYGYPDETLANLQRYSIQQPIPGARVVKTGQPLWFETHEDFQQDFPHLAELRLRNGIHASAFVPMKMNGRVIGLLALSFFQPHPFSDEDKDLLLTFASQCAQALERARLYEAEQASRQRAERNASYLARLLDVASALSRALTPQHVHATFLDAAMATVGADKGAVYLRTPDAEHIRVAYAVGYSAEVIDTYGVVPLSAGLPLDVAMLTGQPLWLESLTTLNDWHEKWSPLLWELELQALAAVPIMFNGRAVGCISLGFTHPRSLLAEEKDLLQALASQCSLSLERANLYELQMQARKRAERNATYLARLQEVNSALSRTDAITPDEVTGVILDALMTSYAASTGAISLLAASGEELVLSCVRGYMPDIVATFKTISMKREIASVEVVKTGQPIWLESQDAYLKRYPQARQEFLRFSDHACVVVPIQHSGRVLGVIALNFDMPRTFSAEDKSLIMTFSTQCGQVLERARLYQRLQEANVELEQRVAARTQQLALTNEELVKSREALRELHTRMLTVIEAERERIAREVHDELGQLLTVVRLEIGRARRDLNAEQPAIAASLTSGLDFVDQSIRSVRRIATELRPIILNDLGLEAALEWQLREFGSRTGIQCHFDQHIGALALDPEHATAAFRIAQEALTNVMRHAQATQVHMTLMANERRLLLKIQDNGVGFGSAPKHGTQSFGVRSMKERAMSVGGRLRVRGVPGAGTTVLLILPLPPLFNEDDNELDTGADQETDRTASSNAFEQTIS